VVVHCSDRHTARDGTLADEAPEGLLRGQETCINCMKVPIGATVLSIPLVINSMCQCYSYPNVAMLV
jgi:hypothetical protein